MNNMGPKRSRSAATKAGSVHRQRKGTSKDVVRVILFVMTSTLTFHYISQLAMGAKGIVMYLDS